MADNFSIGNTGFIVERVEPTVNGFRPKLPQSGAGASDDFDKPVLITQSTPQTINNARELKKATLEGAHVPISDEILIQAIDRAIKAVQGTPTSLEFSVHEKTKELMVKVKDKDTGEVIREIPREITLDFVAKMRELAGIIIDERR